MRCWLGGSDPLDGHLRELQEASPVPLHIMWQTRGGQGLEDALHEHFKGYRAHGDWNDFGDQHPVAPVATAAVDLGYRALPLQPQGLRPALSGLAEILDENSVWECIVVSKRLGRPCEG